MAMQHITAESPASVYVLGKIKSQPGATVAEIAEKSGWSVYHLRNVLRYLRKSGRVKSVRPHPFSGECRWWIGEQKEPVQAPCRVMPALRINGPRSVFDMGAP